MMRTSVPCLPILVNSTRSSSGWSGLMPSSPVILCLATKTSGRKYSVNTASVPTTWPSDSRTLSWWWRPPGLSSLVTVAGSTCHPGDPRHWLIWSGMVHASKTTSRA